MNDYTENWKYSRDDQNLRDDTLIMIAEDLQGTCKPIDETLEWYDLEDSDMAIGDWCILENMVMLCDRCGWWYETNEMDESDGESLCRWCVEDNE